MRPLRPALVAFAEGLGRWRWRLVGLLLLLLAYLLVWIINVHTPHEPLTGLLLTVPALVVLIGGGNLLQGWLGIKHRAPQFADPKDPPVRGGTEGT